MLNSIEQGTGDIDLAMEILSRMGEAGRIQP